MGRLYRQPGIGRGQEHPDRARASARRARPALRAGPGRRRRDPARAAGRVLWRPHLHRPRCRGPCLDLRPDCAQGHQGGGRTGQRAEDRRLDLSRRERAGQVRPAQKPESPAPGRAFDGVCVPLMRAGARRAAPGGQRGAGIGPVPGESPHTLVDRSGGSAAGDAVAARFSWRPGYWWPACP
ncbi:protein of unknown function [Cupriavidus taiwanensis]|nr:protein of unknown function [Cupriavidus taiwanensis]